jgi:Tfp pilus assembly protein PilN
MIQLNLLPDVKLQYIRAKRNRNLVLFGAVAVITVSVGMFVLMFSFVKGVQGEHIKNLTEDIDKGINVIENTQDLDKVLTVQNQLGIVDTKHQEKPAATRALPMITQLLPEGSSVQTYSVDFAGSQISLTGITQDINATNKLVDTLKFAKYTAKTITVNADGKIELGEAKEGKAFSEVVLSSFGTEPGNASFTITMKFDPLLFANSEEVAIVVPDQSSTRSITEKPNVEFIQSEDSGQGAQ